jgi:hypothetical protein
MWNGVEEKCIRGFGGKSEGNIPLVRPRCRRQGNIKMDYRETGYRGLGWIGLVHDREKSRASMTTLMNLRDP